MVKNYSEINSWVLRDWREMGRNEKNNPSNFWRNFGVSWHRPSTQCPGRVFASSPVSALAPLLCIQEKPQNPPLDAAAWSLQLLQSTPGAYHPKSRGGLQIWNKPKQAQQNHVRPGGWPCIHKGHHHFQTDRWSQGRALHLESTTNHKEF